MRRLIRVASALGALLLLAFVLTIGQRIGLPGAVHADAGATGAAEVYMNVINDSMTVPNPYNFPVASVAQAAFTAESSSILRVAGYSKLALGIHVYSPSFVAADTDSTYRFAVQIRAATTDSIGRTSGVTSDSTLEFVWPWGGRDQTAGNSRVDSLGATLFGATTILPHGTGLAQQWGAYEFEFAWAPRMQYGGFRQNDAFAPQGLYLLLQDRLGVPFQAPFMRVRIRCLGGPSRTTAAPKVTCHVFCLR
jgi:hypothetical protein